MHWLGSSSPEYTVLEKRLQEDSTQEFLPHDGQLSRYENGEGAILLHRKTAIGCILGFGAAIVAIIILYVRLIQAQRLQGIGFREFELGLARGFIKKDIQTFTGTLILEPDGSTYRERVPGAPQYFGNDSNEANRNWDKLLKDHNFYITESEAKSQWPDMYKEWYHDIMGYRVGFAVFHNLHCVNELRAVVGQWAYGLANETQEEFDRAHMDHCLDTIRQSLACTADMTPIPQRRLWWPHPHYIDSDQPHTCRDIWKLREFNLQRKRIDLERTAVIEKKLGQKFNPWDFPQGPIGFPDYRRHE